LLRPDTLTQLRWRGSVSREVELALQCDGIECTICAPAEGLGSTEYRTAKYCMLAAQSSETGGPYFSTIFPENSENNREFLKI
jgi:hypothetical protein